MSALSPSWRQSLRQELAHLQTESSRTVDALTTANKKANDRMGQLETQLLHSQQLVKEQVRW